MEINLAISCCIPKIGFCQSNKLQRVVNGSGKLSAMKSYNLHMRQHTFMSGAIILSTSQSLEEIRNNFEKSFLVLSTYFLRWVHCNPTRYFLSTLNCDCNGVIRCKKYLFYSLRPFLLKDKLLKVYVSVY